MKKKSNQPVSPTSFWATQMGNKPQAHQIKGEGLSQGPAFSSDPDPEQEWSDGNGY